MASAGVARVRDRPHTLSHLITSRCNARCRTCLWRGDNDDDLDTDAIAWLYTQAARLGIGQLVVWGGEPLLRPDLEDVLLIARRRGLFVTLITNGWLIPERWAGLRKNVDALILSLDDVGEAHDGLRGLPGLYDRLDAFALSLRSHAVRPTLLVNTVLSRQNAGALPRVAAAARRWGAGLYFCPMQTGEMRAGSFVERKAGLGLSSEALMVAAREARLLKARGYPILNTKAYLDLLQRDPELKSYRCRAPHAVITAAADGAIRDCRRHDEPLARVDQMRQSHLPLSTVLALPRRRQLLTEATTCTVCNNPDVIELSWLWDMHPAMLGKFLQLAGRRR